MSPLGQGHFLPLGLHLKKLGRSPLGDATYQISKLYAFQFQRRRIHNFVRTCDPPGLGLFRPQGLYLKPGRDPLVEATYQTSKLYIYQFQRRRILKIFTFVPLLEFVTPEVGPVFTPEVLFEQTLQRSNRRCYIPNN